jgi:hypothetical protein
MRAIILALALAALAPIAAYADWYIHRDELGNIVSVRGLPDAQHTEWLHQHDPVVMQFMDKNHDFEEAMRLHMQTNPWLRVQIRWLAQQFNKTPQRVRDEMKAIAKQMYPRNTQAP